MFIGFNVK